MSLIFAVSCASCACRCESCRVLEAEVGTVDNREVLWVCVWPGVRGLSDIFAFCERIRWFRMRRFTVIRLSCAKGHRVFLLTSKERVLFTCFRKRKVSRLSTLEESLRRARHLPPFCNQQSIMSNPSTAKIRRIVLTGSIAAITATGAWYGAGLKVQQERNEVGKNLVFSSPRFGTDSKTGQTSNIGGFRRRKAEANGNATRPACSPERRAADQNRSAH